MAGFNSEAEFAEEWTNITKLLKKRVKNLSRIKLCPDRNSGYNGFNDKNNYLAELIAVHYGKTRKSLRMLSDDMNLPYSTVCAKINGRNPWSAPQKALLCGLLGISESDKGEYFDD